jgi:hypothetical protein
MSGQVRKAKSKLKKFLWLFREYRKAA